MDAHRGFHRRFLNKRQHLGGVLGSLLAGSPTSSPVSQSTTATPAAVQGTGQVLDVSVVTSELSSLVSDLPTLVLPSSESSSAATSSAPLTRSSSSSTGSTTSPASSTMTTSSSPPTTSASNRTSTTPTTLTSTPTSTPTPTPIPSGSDTVYVSSDGTSTVYITSMLPAASATAAPTTESFLQNTSLAGGVFALVGIVALIIIFVIVTWTIRKRRRNRRERDTAAAVTFDPGATGHYKHHDASIEKRRLSASSSGHAHAFGYVYGMQPAYAPQQEYRGPAGYGQYSAVAYPTSTSSTAPYQAPSPPAAQPAAKGGANLTRKYSDRKPVPPLLPDPAYDPSNTHVSIPPQFNQQ